MANVLVVDDSAMDRHLAGRLLEKAGGFQVSYAENGVDALRQIENNAPDVVVTDLQMPEMNGLQLVEAVRNRRSFVPIVLMTAHGSEEVAVQALMSGAASYVPKSELARHLLETVQGVVGLAQTGQQQRRLLDHLDRHEIGFVLDNDSSLIPPLVDELQQAVAGMGLVDDTARVQVGVALEEALANALYHGNLELDSETLEDARSSLLMTGGLDPVAERAAQAPYCDRRIRVQATLSRDEARFVIRDDGPGFDARRVADPADPKTLTGEGGRGLVLMRMFMDEVTRNDVGNEVCLIKRRAQLVG